MPRIRVYCDTVPEGDIAMLSRVLAQDSYPKLIALVVDFGYPIAHLLARGAKIATGNDVRGFRVADIALFSNMPRSLPAGFGVRAQIKATIREKIEIPDVPSGAHLAEIAHLMRLQKPEDALNRLLYWLWIASQYTWMYLPVFIMDHARGEWYEYKFDPLLDARDEFEY